MTPQSCPQFTPAQDIVLAALAGGACLSDAANQAKVHRNTVGNWRHSSPAFRDAFAQALSDRAMLVRERAHSLVSVAFHVLEQILMDLKASPSVRLKAALAIMNQAAAPPPAWIADPVSTSTQAETHAQPKIVHNSAQGAPTTYPQSESAPVPESLSPAPISPPSVIDAKNAPVTKAI